MSMKNPLTPAGIESATFPYVAQHLKILVMDYVKNTIFTITHNWIYPKF